jgi:hypothetical protein
LGLRFVHLLSAAEVTAGLIDDGGVVSGHHTYLARRVIARALRISEWRIPGARPPGRFGIGVTAVGAAG